MSKEVKRPLEILDARASVLIPLVCVGLYLYQFSYVWRYAVNLPYWDEWVTFAPTQLPAGLSLHWLFAQHNEHRLATTRLTIWILYQLNGWSVSTHQLLNFAVYGIMLAGLLWVSRKLARDTPAWAHASFIIFLLSTIAIENHVMAYQSQIHFWLLSFLASAYLLFSPAQGVRALLLGSCAAALSIYSVAAGVVSALILLTCFVLFKSLRVLSAPDRSARRQEMSQLLLVSTLVGGSLALWTIGYQRPPGHALASVLSAEYWEYFLNLVAFNFGVDGLSKAAGIWCLIIILAPMLDEAKALNASFYRELSLPNEREKK